MKMIGKFIENCNDKGVSLFVHGKDGKDGKNLNLRCKNCFTEWKNTTKSLRDVQKEHQKSSLDENYKVAKSLQSRLEAISKLDPETSEYSNNMQQITLQEFCWFPIAVFEQGYLMKNGGWGWALLPPEVENRCVTPSKSNYGYNLAYDFLD